MNSKTNPGQLLMSTQLGLLRRFWDEHAQEWINWVRAPGHQDSYWQFHRERFFSLVPPPSSRQCVVDVGCGEGRVGRDLKTRGRKARVADYRVLGIDCSLAMCRAAASHPESSGVVAGDAVRLPLADASADCAIAFMSLQDIDDMPGAIREIARILKDGRHFVFAITHPTYSGGEFSDGGRDKPDEFVIRGSYFETERCISKGVHGDLTMTFYREHRPLQAYAEALNDAGFSIERIYEVTDDDVSKPWHRVPMFLDVLATRRPRAAPADTARDHHSNSSHASQLVYPNPGQRGSITDPSGRGVALRPLGGTLTAPKIFAVRWARRSPGWSVPIISGVSGLIAGIALVAGFH